jgi:hypothetical protein
MADLLIYSDWRVFFIGSSYLNSLGVSFQVTSNLEQYLQAHAKFKIAITTKLFDQIFTENNQYEVVKVIHTISQASNLVFVNDYEVHSYAALYPQCGDNVYWLVPARFNFSFDKNVIFNGGWFHILNNLYKAIPHRLKQLHPYTVKEKLFDALLGIEKPHRTFIYESLIKNNLEDSSMISYHGKTGLWIDEPDVIKLADLQNSNDMVVYDGISTAWSQIIPIGVYNQTAYSLIAETEFNNTYTFFTEKTAKPILSRRLFVPFCGYQYLENLRNIGFKTFNSIIDESFDQIEDNNVRWSKAFEQVVQLSKMDQQLVFEQAKPILEHNYQHFTETNWFENSIQNLLDKIKKLTTSY